MFVVLLVFAAWSSEPVEPAVVRPTVGAGVQRGHVHAFQDQEVKSALARLQRADSNNVVLRYCHWSREGVVAISTARDARRLWILAFEHSDVGVEGARAIADSPHLGNLEVLSLDHSGIDSEALLALAASPYLRALRRLSLPNNSFGEDALREMMKSDLVQTIEVLDLSGSTLTSEAVARTVLASDGMSALQRLQLDDGLSMATTEALLERLGPDGLELVRE